jgi:hypothetical protein
MAFSGRPYPKTVKACASYWRTSGRKDRCRRRDASRLGPARSSPRGLLCSNIVVSGLGYGPARDKKERCLDADSNPEAMATILAPPYVPNDSPSICMRDSVCETDGRSCPDATRTPVDYPHESNRGWFRPHGHDVAVGCAGAVGLRADLQPKGDLQESGACQLLGNGDLCSRGTLRMRRVRLPGEAGDASCLSRSERPSPPCATGARSARM